HRAERHRAAPTTLSLLRRGLPLTMLLSNRVMLLVHEIFPRLAIMDGRALLEAEGLERLT
ncbi:MAG TPA: hypothetical protein VFX76_22485, partial [Roseiflexaceae bacterium]|nr:hypothetical protein [Roseiflexaceae bacterium]